MRVSGAALDGAPQENQDAGTDEAGDQIAKPSAEAKKAQQEISYRGSDDAEHDIHEYAGAGLHEHLGKPAGKATDDDRPFLRRPWFPPLFDPTTIDVERCRFKVVKAGWVVSAGWLSAAQ
jgi:hypothetical protein